MDKLKTITKTNTKELQADFDSAKSFYKKAYVKIKSVQLKGCNGIIYYDGMVQIDLYSYNTKVLTIYKDIQNTKDTIILYKRILKRKKNGYSSTTMRHIKECLKQYYCNIDTCDKLYYISAYTKQNIFNSALWQ